MCFFEDAVNGVTCCFDSVRGRGGLLVEMRDCESVFLFHAWDQFIRRVVSRHEFETRSPYIPDEEAEVFLEDEAKEGEKVTRARGETSTRWRAQGENKGGSALATLERIEEEELKCRSGLKGVFAQPKRKHCAR